MDEACNPPVLHARLCVVEKDSERHEGDIGQLWAKVTTLEICAACLPDIKLSLADIKEDLASLKLRNVGNDRQAVGEEKAGEKASLWNKYPFLGGLVAGGLLLLAGFLLATYAHLLAGGPA